MTSYLICRAQDPHWIISTLQKRFPALRFHSLPYQNGASYSIHASALASIDMSIIHRVRGFADGANFVMQSRDTDGIDHNAMTVARVSKSKN